jgi:hypothetical protein
MSSSLSSGVDSVAPSVDKANGVSRYTDTRKSRTVRREEEAKKLLLLIGSRSARTTANRRPTRDNRETLALIATITGKRCFSCDWGRSMQKSVMLKTMMRTPLPPRRLQEFAMIPVLARLHVGVTLVSLSLIFGAGALRSVCGQETKAKPPGPRAAGALKV